MSKSDSGGDQESSYLSNDDSLDLANHLSGVPEYMKKQEIKIDSLDISEIAQDRVHLNSSQDMN